MNGVPSPPHVKVAYAPCPDTGEGTCSSTDTVYLTTRDRYTRQHELGHLAAWQLLDDAEQNAMEPLLGVSKPTLWNNGTGEDCYGRKCPSELFADAYASCRLGMLPEGRRRDGVIVGSWETAYGYWPETNASQRRTCRAMRRYLATPSNRPL